MTDQKLKCETLTPNQSSLRQYRDHRKQMEEEGWFLISQVNVEEGIVNLWERPRPKESEYDRV